MKHLELFSGIGGFRMAMELLQRDGIKEFTHIGFSEIDKKAIKTYKANFDTKEEIEIGDIVDFTEDFDRIKNLPDFDILTGGFPCQSFSMMGKQLGFNDDRGTMFFRIMDIVRVKHPRYLLLENVKNLYTHDKGKTFKIIKGELEKEGYKVFSDIFNTEKFGLPQTRNRIIIFATREEIPESINFNSNAVEEDFLNFSSNCSLHIYENVLDILKSEVDSKYFLSERIKPTILSNGSKGFRSNSSINLFVARPLTATMHKMHRACQDNYYSQEFIESKGENKSAQSCSKEELCKLHIRRLTPVEAMLLQGFSEDFATNAQDQQVADGSLYKQAGNAVSVNTIYSVLHYLCVNQYIN